MDWGVTLRIQIELGTCFLSILTQLVHHQIIISTNIIYKLHILVYYNILYTYVFISIIDVLCFFLKHVLASHIHTYDVGLPEEGKPQDMTVRGNFHGEGRSNSSFIQGLECLCSTTSDSMGWGYSGGDCLDGGLWWMVDTAVDG